MKLAVFLGLPKEKRTPEAVADKYYEVLNDALKSGEERFNEIFNILSQGEQIEAIRAEHYELLTNAVSSNEAIFRKLFSVLPPDEQKKRVIDDNYYLIRKALSSTLFTGLFAILPSEHQVRLIRVNNYHLLRESLQSNLSAFEMFFDILPHEDQIRAVASSGYGLLYRAPNEGIFKKLWGVSVLDARTVMLKTYNQILYTALRHDQAIFFNLFNVLTPEQKTDAITASGYKLLKESAAFGSTFVKLFTQMPLDQQIVLLHVKEIFRVAHRVDPTLVDKVLQKFSPEDQIKLKEECCGPVVRRMADVLFDLNSVERGEAAAKNPGSVKEKDPQQMKCAAFTKAEAIKTYFDLLNKEPSIRSRVALKKSMPPEVSQVIREALIPEWVCKVLSIKEREALTYVHRYMRKRPVPQGPMRPTADRAEEVVQLFKIRMKVLRERDAGPAAARR